jgi:hypothetical protein
VPPCARVRAGSVLFVGTVVDPRLPADGKKGSTRNVRLQVDEIFEGLPAGTKEVVVTTEDSWLLKGHSYLMDTVKGEDGHLYPEICGASGDMTDGSIADILDFLRQRARGKAKASLAVRVFDNHQPLSDVDVTITGPAGHLTTRTGADGVAMFEEIKPADYSLNATREHYRLDAEGYSVSVVDVVAGTCPGAMIELRADSMVQGRVVDSKGEAVSALDLELITAQEDPSERVFVNKPFFLATTDAKGAFVFDSVSPGRYILGSNIIGLNSSSVPATFYPGQRAREGAYPIEVKLGQTVDGLVFTLPDFGVRREIQVCVVDEKGNPTPGATLTANNFGHTGGDFARLGKDLMTDETGCVNALGYTKAAYSVKVIMRPTGGGLLGMRLSDNLVIDPGEEPVHRVLVLKQAIGLPK